MLRRLIVIAIAHLCGCSSVSSVKNEPSDVGSTRIFRANAAVVTEAAKMALPEFGMKIESINTAEGAVVLLADQGMTLWSYGQIVRVRVEPMNSGTSVRVIWRDIYQPNTLSKQNDRTEDLFTRIGLATGEYP